MAPTTETRQRLYKAEIAKDETKISSLKERRSHYVAQGQTALVDAIDVEIRNAERMRDGRIERMKKGDD